MSMLAAPRRKQKWSLNPRGKDWTEDSNKFGQKMLEKMGWTSGKGLGANEQGMTDIVRVKLKNDNLGIGCTKERDDHWIDCQDGFNEFLENLQKEQSVSESKNNDNDVPLSGKSLEQKSKLSSVRVHYQKFTRGKDVNKYSKKDLANIFGKKDLDISNKNKKVELSKEEEPQYEEIGTMDVTGGVMTIKGGNMVDYFKSKSYSNENNVNGYSYKKIDSDSETEMHTGFGFGYCSKNEPTKIKSEPVDFMYDNPCLSTSDKKLNLSTDKTNNVCLNKQENEQNYEFDNPCLDISLEEKSVKVKKEFPSDENVSEVKKKSKKKKKHDQAYDNPGLSLNVEDAQIKQELEEIPENLDTFLNNDVQNSTKSSKNKKIKKSLKSGLDNPCLDIDILEEKPIKSKKRKSNHIDTDETTIENHTPKKIKTSKAIFYDDLSEPQNKENCFVNKALDLDLQSSQVSAPVSEFEVSRSKLKIENCAKSKNKENGFINEALDLDLQSSQVNKPACEFEVSRSALGIENSALDLSDENNKKRVTFNNYIEYDNETTDRKKKSKLDKYEVINPKLKKKSKSNKNKSEPVCFVNEALDFEIMKCEEVDNEINEKKSKKRKKRKEKKLEILETIVEVPEEDNTEGSLNVKKDDTVIIENEIITLDEFISENQENVDETPKKKMKKNKIIKSDTDANNVEFVDISGDSKDVPKKKKKKKKKLELDDANDKTKEDMVMGDTENNCLKKEAKKKKGKKPQIENDITIEEFLNEIHKEDPTPNNNLKNINEEINLKTKNTLKKSKNVMKLLFNKNPTVLFNGSNINEIEGYGSQFYA